MDPELVQAAQAEIRSKTPNATCPMCGGTTWADLPDVVGVIAALLKDGAGADRPEETLNEVVQDGSVHDTSNVTMGRLHAVGFSCENCSYLRLHG